MPTYLTEHFTLEEMTHSDTANACGIDNSCPTPDIEANLKRLAECLEKIRTICASKPVIVSSGYRCTELNEEVGGVVDSAHRFGLGADITIPEYGTPMDICMAVEPHLAELAIDQLIDEHNNQGHRWVHVGLSEGPPRCECFTL